MSVFRDDVLRGRVAVITGGATGICKGIARSYLEHGAKVVITSRKQENLDAAVKELEHSGEVMAVAADVRKPEEVEAVIKATVDKFGHLDTVINGAAGNFLCPASQLSYNAFRTVLEIDTMGTFNVSKASFSHLVEAGEQGRDPNIINISATLQYVGTPLQAHVSAAKAGIDALMRNLAVEWGPLGIRVNNIAPGPIGDTEGMRRLAPDPDITKAMTERIPLQRFGKVQEIADMAVFLASPAAHYITGAIMVVDGGHWLATQGFSM